MRASVGGEPNTIAQRYGGVAEVAGAFLSRNRNYNNFPSAGLPVHEMALDEGITTSNRHFRDVLVAKGYDVTYVETATAHEPLHWRATLADALHDVAVCQIAARLSSTQAQRARRRNCRCLHEGSFPQFRSSSNMRQTPYAPALVLVFCRQPTKSAMQADVAHDLNSRSVDCDLWQELGNNLGTIAPEHRVRGKGRANQNAKRVNTIDHLALPAKPPSPVQIRAAPPILIREIDVSDLSTT